MLAQMLALLQERAGALACSTLVTRCVVASRAGASLPTLALELSGYCLASMPPGEHVEHARVAVTDPFALPCVLLQCLLFFTGTGWAGGGLIYS